MKIGDRNGIQDPRVGESPVVDSRRPGEIADKSGDPSDHLEVSAYARALHRLVAGVQALPDDSHERAAKVAKLQQAVDGGTYAADLHETARKLLLDLA